LGKGKNVGSYS